MLINEWITDADDFGEWHARILADILWDRGYSGIEYAKDADNRVDIPADVLKEAINEAYSEFERRSKNPGCREYYSEHDEGLAWCHPILYRNTEDGCAVLGILDENGEILYDPHDLHELAPDERPQAIEDAEIWKPKSGNCHSCPFLACCQAFDDI